MSPSIQTLGEKGEILACEYLRKSGYKILTRNFHIPGGEIDVIVEKEKELVFVEVKTRSSQRFGYPEEGVTFSKCLRMRKAMKAFLKRYPASMMFRVDIIAVIIDPSQSKPVIHHIPNIDFPEV